MKQKAGFGMVLWPREMVVVRAVWLTPRCAETDVIFESGKAAGELGGVDDVCQLACFICGDSIAAASVLRCCSWWYFQWRREDGRFAYPHLWLAPMNPSCAGCRRRRRPARGGPPRRPMSETRDAHRSLAFRQSWP